MDNGINFRSQGLLTFLKTNGITSKFTTQFNPATNEQMVRFVQILKLEIKKNLDKK